MIEEELGFWHREEDCASPVPGALSSRACTWADTCQFTSQVRTLPTLQPTTKEQQPPQLQTSFIKTNDVLVDAADMNRRTLLPAGPRVFFWLEHPRGRTPGRAAPSCCSAPRPPARSGYSPAWFVKPLQSTEGNPLWRSCRYASFPAPQHCPALVGEDSLNIWALPVIPDTSVSVRFWICLKRLENSLIY